MNSWLMRIYRAGHQAAQGFVAQSVRDLDLDSAVQTPALLRLWDRTSQWLNVSLEVLTDTYTEERERGLRGALARRTATAHAILRGDQVDQDTATTQLGYPLRQTHTALVLWADELPVGVDPVAHLEAATNALAAAVAAPNVLTVPSGARGLWAWFTGAFEFGELALPDGVRVAAGEPGRGMAGFRRGHVEALAAQRIAERTPDRPRFTRYADVEIAHLVSADETAARALVARELRGLTGDDPSARQLRQTLHAYLAADRSPEAAARALHVHKNTVRYRINRVEQLLGHPVAERRLHLELALAYLRTTDDTESTGA